MPDLSIIDLITPYVFRAVDVGAWHPALSVLAVTEHETTVSQEGVAIRGIVQIHGDVRPRFDPNTMTFGIDAGNDENHPANEPGRRNPWIDIRDTRIEFQLTTQRTVSARATQAIGALPAGNTKNVLNAYDPNTGDPPPSDFPSTEFRLDFILTSVVLRPPFLRGAKRMADGQLVPDTENQEVRFTLPKIRLRLSQGPSNTDPLVASLLSVGAHSLDSPADLLVAELITMSPPYAFIGDSNVVGFGFRSAVLDLSNGTTPPEILEQFGFDPQWTGLYLPEIRLFVAPNGAKDLAVDAGARNLLIGLGQSGGITGDFDLSVLNQESGTLKVGARFYDESGVSYGITWTGTDTAKVQLPARTRMVVDIDGGRPPLETKVSFDGAQQPIGRTHEVNLANPQMAIVINVDDAGVTQDGQPNKLSGHLTITASRLPSVAAPPQGSQPQTQTPPVDLVTTSVKRGNNDVGAPRLRVVSETASTATIGLDSGADANWTIGNKPPVFGKTATVDVIAGEPAVSIKAEIPGGNPVTDFTAYYRYDHPKPESDPSYATIKGSSMTAAAPDEGAATPWSAGNHSMDALGALLAKAGDTQQITIKGYASYEGHDTPQSQIYNTDLAQRRADGLEAMVRKHMEPGGKAAGKSFQIQPDPVADMSTWKTQGTTLETRRDYWKAVGTFPGGIQPDALTVNGLVSRRPIKKDPGKPIVVPDPPMPAEPPSPPSFFRQIGAKVRIVRNQFVACEVFGRFDIQTATENRLNEVNAGAGTSLPDWKKMGQNPADGLIDIRVLVQIDDAKNEVTVLGYIGADPADTDGLAMVEPPQGEEPSTALNLLGASCVFLPVVAAASNAVANNGALAEIGVTVGAFTAITAIAGLGWLKTLRVIWFGGEMKVVANKAGEWSASVLLDIETAIYMDNMPLDLITIPKESPVMVRYKAIGFMFGNPAGQQKFQFKPVFDSSKGYTIDVSRPGAVKVRPPLDKVLQILGARIAKNNPMIFELDLGFAINLSVITIERARIRATIYNENGGGGSVELTAFGASVDISGAVRGRGYVEIGDGKFVGQIDITIVPVSVRIAAGIGIEQIKPENGGPATGVIVTLDVSFPVAIPLGTSGLGIYGFIGLFAMHWARNEENLPSDAGSPALAWLKKVNGNPVDLIGWKAKADNWAFGVGALLGTMGSSVIFNLKGLFMLELPGPRLLLMMKAKLLMPMPARVGPSEGLLFAVIDLDLGRKTLTIGISVSFEIKLLLKIHIPVEAFFDFKVSENWHLYLGQHSDMVQADILQVFEGCGYLMICGNGIQGIPDLPAVSGFSIATGLHVSFIWGSKASGLYAELAAGFDAVVGFDPFRFAGILYVRGTLSLWIIEISAWAKLKVDMGEDQDGHKISHIAGEICGEVEFLFFTISGCVDFELGSGKPVAPIPPLVKGVRLISRSPALVVGTGTGRPIDGGIGEASDKDHDTPEKELPVVPIDSIPVIMMSAPPLVADGMKFKNEELNHTPGAPADGWVARGDTYYKYTLKTVALSETLSAGKTPATWWEPKSGDTALEAQLALLSWIPEATPKAIEYSKHLEDWIEEHWGTICSPVAPPAPVMWNFMREVVGASPPGWWLDGKAWPDPPNTVRDTPVDLWVRVHERWRCGNKKVDQLRGLVPAIVEAAAVACPPPKVTPPTTTVTALQTAREERREREFVDVIGVARGRKELDPLTLSPMSRLDIMRSINAGLPVSRSAYTALTPAATVPTTTTVPGAATTPPVGVPCQSRVLAAPLFDDYWRASFNPVTFRDKLIKDELAKRKYKPGPLIDAVVINTGEIDYATFFLFVPRTVVVSKQLVVDVMNANEQVLVERVVTTADVMPAAQLPPRWTDPSGPWEADMFRLLQHKQYLEQKYGYQGVIVKVTGKKGGDRIQIGLKAGAANLLKSLKHRPFYVAAFEGLRSAEVWRFDYETKQQSHKKEIAGVVLSSEASDYALMMPNKTYEVTVEWDASRERRPKNESPQDGSSDSGSAKFYFKTDATAPERLDPWILAALPQEGEQHYFADDGLKVVFGTNNVVRMYDTYNKRLQIRLKASSFRQIPDTPNAPHPLKLNDLGEITADLPNLEQTVKPVSQSVVDPFEEALGDLLENSCVPVDHARIRHSVVDIKSPLDLFTDYVLDIEMLNKNAPDGAVGNSIWRRSFSTGGFRTLEAFARSFFTARVEHRWVKTGELQQIGVDFATKDPIGNELDARLIEAGLEPPETPDHPRLVVYWQVQPQGSDPQPAALIIDGSEPLWRERLLPREIPDATVEGAKRYELTPVLWLEPSEHTAGNPVADQIVEHIVKAPGGQRALVTFAPGKRGKRLRLALKRVAQTEPYLDGPGNPNPSFINIADMILDRAPWEEED